MSGDNESEKLLSATIAQLDHIRNRVAILRRRLVAYFLRVKAGLNADDFDTMAEDFAEMADDDGGSSGSGGDAGGVSAASASAPAMPARHPAALARMHPMLVPHGECRVSSTTVSDVMQIVDSPLVGSFSFLLGAHPGKAHLARLVSLKYGAAVRLEDGGVSVVNHLSGHPKYRAVVPARPTDTVDAGAVYILLMAQPRDEPVSSAPRPSRDV